MWSIDRRTPFIVLNSLLSSQGSLFAYFHSGWGIVDFVSTVFSMACMFLWWDWVLRKATPFNVEVRYNVYADLKAPANFLRLADEGEQLMNVEEAMARLQVTHESSEKVVRALYTYMCMLAYMLLYIRACWRQSVQSHMGTCVCV